MYVHLQQTITEQLRHLKKHKNTMPKPVYKASREFFTKLRDIKEEHVLTALNDEIDNVLDMYENDDITKAQKNDAVYLCKTMIKLYNMDPNNPATFRDMMTF